MSVTLPDRVCAACTSPAVAIVDHPEHGERAACDEHAEDYEVVRDV